LPAVLLVQALSLIGHLQNLYGPHGVVDAALMQTIPSPGVPNLAWLDKPLSFLGVPLATGVPLVYAVYVGGLLCLLLGYRTRFAATLAWLSHTALVTSGEFSAYGVDRFAQIGLFYCLWIPVGHAFSLDRKANRVKGGTLAAWLGLRVLQLHVCIAYTASGIEKSLGEQWWNGEAIWRAVMGAPVSSFIDCSFLATWPGLAKAACWMTLVLEGGIVLFVWHPRLRKLWLIGIVTMHLGIALFLNLWSFSAAMIVFDIAAFGCPPCQPRPTA
jgi:hypothetical protein